MIFEDACRHILLKHIALCVRAGLESVPTPEIEVVNVHLCEDEKTGIIYGHLTNDNLTGGLPLWATFDAVNAEHFDGRAYEAAFERYVAEFDSAVLNELAP